MKKYLTTRNFIILLCGIIFLLIVCNTWQCNKSSNKINYSDTIRVMKNNYEVSIKLLDSKVIKEQKKVDSINNLNKDFNKKINGLKYAYLNISVLYSGLKDQLKGKNANEQTAILFNRLKDGTKVDKHPTSLIVEKDSCVLLSIEQVSYVNLAFLSLDECEKQRENLIKQNFTRDSLITNLEKIILSKDITISLVQAKFDTCSVYSNKLEGISTDMDKLIKKQEKMIKRRNFWVKFFAGISTALTLYTVGTIVAR